MQFIIAIRFTTQEDLSGQLTDLEVPISINFERDAVNTLVNVKWLRTCIRNQVAECANRRLRLIFGGKVLTEKTNFEKEVFQPRIRQYTKELEENPQQNRGPIKLYIHCLIGDTLSKQQLNQENMMDNIVPQEINGTERMGFDRLLDQGFSPEDIQDFRAQFHAMNNHPSSTNTREQINDLEEEEIRQSNLRQLEERWIESRITPGLMDGDLTTSTSRQGSQRAPTVEGQDPTQSQFEVEGLRKNEDLLIGLMIGTFLGVISLVFLAVDDSVFNERQKMSIVGGVFINFWISVIQTRFEA